MMRRVFGNVFVYLAAGALAAAAVTLLITTTPPARAAGGCCGGGGGGHQQHQGKAKSGAQQQHSEDAARKTPMLHVSALSGEYAGKEFCPACNVKDKPYAVVFIKEYDGMVLDFAKQVEELLGEREDLGALIVPLQDRRTLEARLKRDLRAAGLKRVTFGFLTEEGAKDAGAWRADKDKQTNVFVLKKGEIAQSFAAGCPHCEGVSEKIAKAFPKA